MNSVHPGDVNTAMSNPAARRSRRSTSTMRTCRRGVPACRTKSRATLFLASDAASCCNDAAPAVDGGMAGWRDGGERVLPRIAGCAVLSGGIPRAFGGDVCVRNLIQGLPE
ncbi:hypothetical protein [Burkholderia seminalis]|uniref:hypothetical protein n=1 Tax=Burkholderia seminalis TaxID=488731 RepID=UPI003451A076